MNDNGYVEIGYVFTYLAATMVLISVIGTTSNLGREATEAGIEIVFQDMVDRIADGVDEAIFIAELLPDSRFNKTILIQSQIEGTTNIYDYNVIATNETIYINASGIRVKSLIHNSGNITISGSVKGKIIVKEIIVGGKQEINIGYSNQNITIS